MRFSSIALVVLFALQTGCWPRIPGEWEEYRIPEEATLIGEYRAVNPVGEYWEDPSPTANFWWGDFEQPKAAWPYEVYVPQLDTCVVDQPEPTWMAELSQNGSGVSTIRTGSNVVELAWDADGAGLFYGSIPVPMILDDTSWSLDTVTLEGVEPFALDEFFHVPPRLEWIEPAMNGAEARDLYPYNVDFEWNAPEEVEQILLELVLRDDGNSRLETITCVVSNTGFYSIPTADMWTQWPSAAFMFVSIGTYQPMNEKLEFSEGGNRVAAVNGFMGAGYTVQP